jgi:hypothetical protein
MYPNFDKNVDRSVQRISVYQKYISRTTPTESKCPVVIDILKTKLISSVLLTHLLAIVDGLKSDLPKDDVVQNALVDFTAEIEKRLAKFDRKCSKSSKSSNSFRKH